MKLARIGNLVLLFPLAVSTGLVKIFGMKAEVELFAKIGIEGASFVAFGVFQSLCGLLLLHPRTRAIGAIGLIPSFVIATRALFVSGVQPFGWISIAFIAMAATAAWPLSRAQAAPAATA